MRASFKIACLFALALSAIVVGERVQLTQSVDAQPVAPSGLRAVTTNAPGICSGSGLTTNPLDCHVTTDGVSLSGTGSAGAPITYLLPNSDMGVFGSGLDGACVFDGAASVTTLGGSIAPAANVYTLLSDIHCTTISISSGVTVFTNTWRIFARTSLANSGKISCNGNDASGATAGAAITATNGGLTGGCAGATGGTGVGAQAPAGNPGTPLGWASLGGGGAGGAGVSGGGASRALGAVYTAAQGDIATIQNAIQHRSTNNVFISSGGCGAVGGSAGGGGGAGTTGGGGGGGACNVVVVAPIFTGSGTIEAKGGNGGNGSNSGTATGGGGGGKGAYVTLAYSNGTAPTATVTGGAKGLHGSGGGVDGNNGTDGLVHVWNVGAQ